MFYKLIFLFLAVNLIQPLQAQIGTRFPSERKVIKDPVTGYELIFLTSTPAGDSKIYPTHNQWTSDGKWIIFRSRRVEHEAMAVNEETGDIVQVTEGGYWGALCVARKSMKLYYMRGLETDTTRRTMVVIEVDLAALFADSEAGTLKEAPAYQRICGTTPPELHAHPDMTLDGSEEWVWFTIGKKTAQEHLPDSIELESNYGPRHMGAGPGGIAGMNILTGETKYVVSVPFQVGHIQSNPWVPGQIIFCWETGGKSPQRTWIVNSDGSGLRPLYPEALYEWVTHEAVIGPKEVAFAIMGHRPVKDAAVADSSRINPDNPGQEEGWGNCGTREKPTGMAIVNINTHVMQIVAQIPHGSGFWHVHGSPDGKLATGDDFDRNLYLINRSTGEMILLSAGHKRTARDHVHPTFNSEGTKINIQSAMLSEDNESLNICVIPVSNIFENP